jgi:hypothetical protein
MRFRDRRFRELAQTSANGLLRKSDRPGPTENLPPPTFYVARDWNLIGILTDTAPGLWTTARQDFSPPWVVCNSSKIRWKMGGVGRVLPEPDF